MGRTGQNLTLDICLVAPIHRSAWKAHTANFALPVFCTKFGGCAVFASLLSSTA
jgi:hypothetical protein